jgi:peptide/nickel transport system substrate-binding protein
LGGDRVIFAKQRSLHVVSNCKGEAMIEFPGFSPKSRDTLKCALADQITVPGVDRRYAPLSAPNGLLQPIGDSQLCQALTSTVGGWRGSESLAGQDGVKIVGGVVLPDHSFAATKIVLHIDGHLAGPRFAGWNPSGNRAL